MQVQITKPTALLVAGTWSCNFSEYSWTSLYCFEVWRSWNCEPALQALLRLGNKVDAGVLSAKTTMPKKQTKKSFETQKKVWLESKSLKSLRNGFWQCLWTCQPFGVASLPQRNSRKYHWAPGRFENLDSKTHRNPRGQDNWIQLRVNYVCIIYIINTIIIINLSRKLVCRTEQGSNRITLLCTGLVTFCNAICWIFNVLELLPQGLHASDKL